MANIQPKNEVECQEHNLSFVKRNPMLKQVMFRDPKDNLYPHFKSYLEYGANDMEELMK